MNQTVASLQPPTGDEVQSLLREQYCTHSNVHHLRELSRGRNAVFDVDLGSEHVVVKCGRNHDAFTRLTRHAALACGLSAMGGAAEEVLHTSEGELVGKGPDGLVVVAFRKIRGGTCNFTRGGYGRLGLALALWHRAAVRVKLDAGVLSSLSPAEVLVRAEKGLLCTRPPSVHGRPAFVLSQTGEQRLTACLRFLHSQLHQYEDLEPWVGHGDPHPLNLLRPVFSSGLEIPTLIDLEDAYHGSRLHDLGTMVWSTLRCEPARPLWMAALDAYNQELSLSSRELDQVGYYVALRQLWWLELHARHWGQYTIHYRESRFIDVGVELLEAICQDACGAKMM